MNTIFFVGSYTEMITADFGGKGDGIYTLSLNNKTGKITHLHTLQTQNPSYLAVCDNKNFLYSITEVGAEKSPKIQAFTIQADYSLKLINEIEIAGSLPCHIAFVENKLVVSCYGSANVLLFSTSDSGALIENSSVASHSGSSINPARQEAPHPHQAVFCATQNKIYVPDLGLDAVKVYLIENNELKPVVNNDIAITAGSGPRHLVFNEKQNLAYLLNELTAKISVLKLVDGVFVEKAVYKTLPDSFKDQPSASAIRLHPGGDFLYVANRTWDGITVFKIDGEELHLKDYKMMKAKTIRDFTISPDGDWLIAALQDSNILKVFEINGNGTLLEKKKKALTIGSPVSVLFLDK